MLRIRYQRVGRRNQPSYRIIVTDKENPPQGGNSIAVLGFYNPITKERRVDGERAQYWLERGAQPSQSVKKLLSKEGIT